MDRTKSNENSAKVRKADCRTMAKEIIELLQQAASLKPNLPNHQSPEYHETDHTNQPVDSYAQQLQNDFGNIILGSSKESMETKRQPEEEIHNMRTSSIVSVVNQPHPSQPSTSSPLEVTEMSKKPKKHKYRNKEDKSISRLFPTSLLGRCKTKFKMLALIVDFIKYVISWPIVLIATIVASPWNISLYIFAKSHRALEYYRTAVDTTSKSPKKTAKVSNSHGKVLETPVQDVDENVKTCDALRYEGNYRPTVDNLTDTGTPVSGRQSHHKKISRDLKKKFTPFLEMLDEMQIDDHPYNQMPTTGQYQSSCRYRYPSSTAISSDCYSSAQYSDKFVEKDEHRRNSQRLLQEPLIGNQCRSNSNRMPSLKSSLVRGSNSFNDGEQYECSSMCKNNPNRNGSECANYDQYSECQSSNIIQKGKEYSKKRHRESHCTQSVYKNDECISLDCQDTDYDSQLIEDSPPRTYIGSAQSMSPGALSINLRKRRYKQSRDSVVSRSSIVSSSEEDGFESQIYPRRLKSRSGNIRYHNQRLAEKDLHVSEICCRRKQQSFIATGSSLHRGDGQAQASSTYQQKDYNAEFSDNELQCTLQTAFDSVPALRSVEEETQIDSDKDETIERKRQKKEILLIPLNPEQLQYCNQMSMLKLEDLVQKHKVDSKSGEELVPTQLQAQKRINNSNSLGYSEFPLQHLHESSIHVAVPITQIKQPVQIQTSRSEFYSTDFDIVTDAEIKFSGYTANRARSERESTKVQDEHRCQAETEISNNRSLTGSGRSCLNIGTRSACNVNTVVDASNIRLGVDAVNSDSAKRSCNSQLESEFLIRLEPSMEITNLSYDSIAPVNIVMDTFQDQAETHPVKLDFEMNEHNTHEPPVDTFKTTVSQTATDISESEKSRIVKIDGLDNTRRVDSMGIEGKLTLRQISMHGVDQKNSELSLHKVHPSLIHIAEKLHQQQKEMAHQSQLLIQQQAELIHHQRMQMFSPKAVATAVTDQDSATKMTVDYKSGIRSNCTGTGSNSTVTSFHISESSYGLEPMADLTNSGVSQMSTDIVKPLEEFQLPSDTPVRDQGLRPTAEDPKDGEKRTVVQRTSSERQKGVDNIEVDQSPPLQTILEDNAIKSQLSNQTDTNALQSVTRDVTVTQTEIVQTKDEESTKPVDAKAKWLEIKRKFYGENYGRPTEPEQLEPKFNGEPCSKPPAHKIFQYNMRVGRARQMGTEPPTFESVCMEQTPRTGVLGVNTLGLAMMAMMNPRSNSQLPAPLQPTLLPSSSPHSLVQTQSLLDWSAESDVSHQRKQHLPIPKPRKGKERRRRIRDSSPSSMTTAHGNPRVDNFIPHRTICSVSTSDVNTNRHAYSTNPSNKNHNESAPTPSRPQEKLIQLSDGEEEKVKDQGDVTIEREDDPWDCVVQGRKKSSVPKILQHPSADHTAPFLPHSGINLPPDKQILQHGPGGQPARVRSAANFYRSQNMEIRWRPEGSGPVVALAHSPLCFNQKSSYPIRSHNSCNSDDCFDEANDKVK